MAGNAAPSDDAAGGGAGASSEPMMRQYAESGTARFPEPSHAGDPHGDGGTMRTNARTSMFSNIDGDGPAQLMLGNASLLPRWVAANAPRLSCSAKALLVLLSLLTAYVAATIFFDATAAAAVPFGARARQSVTSTLPFQAMYPFPGTPWTGTTLRITNAFEHGLTRVVLTTGSAKEVTVHLTVDTAQPLHDAVTITNSSCNSLHDSWGGGPCKAPHSNSAQLNITVAPPASCDERCPWYWLWYPCRCHASTNLTVIVPNSTNYDLSFDGTHLRAFVQLAVQSAGTSVRIEPGVGLKVGQMLQKVEAHSDRGDVAIERLVGVGGIRASSGRGIVSLIDVVGGEAINATGAATIVDGAVVAQPCVFINASRSWLGGGSCASLDAPRGPLPKNETPIGIVLGTLNLSATGGVFGASAIVSGQIGAGLSSIRASDGLAVLSNAQFAGSLHMDMPGGAGEANLVNVLALDCSICKNSSALGDLFWNELALNLGGHKEELFCACEPTDASGISFNSTSSKLVAAFVIANQIHARSDDGALSFDELVLTPPSKPHNGSMTTRVPPTLDASSTYGAVSLNGMIAEKATASTFRISLASMAGNVKAVFTGGAINGTYNVTTMRGGIGHVGIVVDNAPTGARSGMIGAPEWPGDAKLTISHSYGDVALAMSSPPPSILALFMGGLQTSSARIGEAQCGEEQRPRADTVPLDWLAHESLLRAREWLPYDQPAAFETEVPL